MSTPKDPFKAGGLYPQISIRNLSNRGGHHRSISAKRTRGPLSPETPIEPEAEVVQSFVDLSRERALVKLGLSGDLSLTTHFIGVGYFTPGVYLC